MNEKVVRHHRFARKKIDKIDRWPDVKKAIEDHFPELLGEENIVVKVTHETASEVRFDVTLKACNAYSFGTLYDLYLRTHDLTL